MGGVAHWLARALAQSGEEGGFRDLLDVLPQVVFRQDRRGRITFANRAFCQLVRLGPDEVLGREDVSLVGEEHVERARLDDQRALDSGESFEADYAGSEGSGPTLRVLRAPFRDGRGEVLGFFGVAWEVSVQSRRVERLEQENLFFRTLMDALPDAIYFKDRDSRLTWANRRALEAFAATTLTDLLGKSDFDLFSPPQARQSFRDEQEIMRSGRPLVNVEEEEILADGGTRWASTTKMPLVDPRGWVVGTFGISRDISERKHAEARFEYQAFYDAVTDLPNRALFMNRLEHLLRRARRKSGAPLLFALVCLDVDRFKGVNDSLGHQQGDDLLVQIARRLETCVRPGDTLARLGGDEFTVLLEDIRSETDATRVAERIHKALAEPFTVGGTDVFISASLGIALSSSGYVKPEEMLRDADIAMYRAKSKGRSRHEVFDADMHRRAVSMLQLETDLRRAVERDECRLYYQPIVDLETGRMVGFEALLRWQHPRRGLVMPDVFIPLAEETGLITPLGLWSMREACRQMKEWQLRFPKQPPLTMNVNVSARQLGQPDLVERVQQIMAETGIHPTSLVAEMTESALMQDARAGATVLHRLHDLGVRIHIDDFGTGYSSLSYLQSFPVDTLKVDRSFVSRMTLERGQSEIVRAVVALAQNLGMGVTAEGVETAEQIAALRALRCTRAQGFYFARPVPAREAEELLVRGLPKF
jgi:diguanylate cyclase (GGDEF)-like protein/PAS domain S-box-containing protein